MTRDRQPAIRVSRFVFQGCGCGHEKGGHGGIVSAGKKRRKRRFFSSAQTSCEERFEKVVRGASHLPARRGRQDTKSALEDSF